MLLPLFYFELTFFFSVLLEYSKAWFLLLLLCGFLLNRKNVMILRETYRSYVDEYRIQKKSLEKKHLFSLPLKKIFHNIKANLNHFHFFFLIYKWISEFLRYKPTAF